MNCMNLPLYSISPVGAGPAAYAQSFPVGMGDGIVFSHVSITLPGHASPADASGAESVSGFETTEDG